MKRFLTSIIFIFTLPLTAQTTNKGTELPIADPVRFKENQTSIEIFFQVNELIHKDLYSNLAQIENKSLWLTPNQRQTLYDNHSLTPFSLLPFSITSGNQRRLNKKNDQFIKSGITVLAAIGLASLAFYSADKVYINTWQTDEWMIRDKHRVESFDIGDGMGYFEKSYPPPHEVTTVFTELTGEAGLVFFGLSKVIEFTIPRIFSPSHNEALRKALYIHD